MLIVWFLSIKSLPNLLFGVLCLPGDQSHLVCTTVNKPSCVLHLLGWFIGSRGFSSLERRPEFWVLHHKIDILCMMTFKLTGQELHTSEPLNQPKMNRSVLAKI